MSKESRTRCSGQCTCILLSAMLGFGALGDGNPAHARQREGEPVACNLSDPELRERKQQIERELVPLVRGVERSPVSLVVLLPKDEDTAATVARFMALEAECCGFADYTLHVGAADEITLTIEVPPRGREVLDVWEDSLRGER